MAPGDLVSLAVWSGIEKRPPKKWDYAALPFSGGAQACTLDNTRQGVKLCLVQSLRDVRDQVGRVFNADRKPDRGVKNTYFLADLSRHAGVRHACGQAGERFRTTQADR
jgi:hypothetical protein